MVECALAPTGGDGGESSSSPPRDIDQSALPGPPHTCSLASRCFLQHCWSPSWRRLDSMTQILPRHGVTDSVLTCKRGGGHCLLGSWW